MNIQYSKSIWEFRNIKPIEFCNEDQIPSTEILHDQQWNGIIVYIGVKLRCSECKSEFEFSANEQKTWYENYGFSIHSYPISCKECRQICRNIKTLNKRLSIALGKKTFDLSDYNEITDIAFGLLQNNAVMGDGLKQKLVMAAKRADSKQRISVLEKLRPINS